MQWFKFYGQDWLTDTKVASMCVEDRIVFITLLCLADKNGVIKNCHEYTLLNLAQIPDEPFLPHNPRKGAEGVLHRLCDNGMITNDNNNEVIIVNWSKRQSQSLTGYERVKRYRERKKLENTPLPDDNDDNVNDNARIEENRIDNTPLADARGYTLEDENAKPKKEPRDKTADKQYEELCLWAETRRGFKFPARKSEYSALKRCRESDISITRLKNRWMELEGDSWRKDGFDWWDVFKSFNKKA